MNESLADYGQAAVMDGQARYALDKKLYVQFYTRAVMNNFKSAQEGRPIFDELDFVRIIIPGDRNNVVDTEVTQEHRIRFQEQYDRFKKNQEQAVSGTPLEVWPQMTVGMVAELKAQGIHTVEQLADLPDGLAQKFMGSFALRQKAKTFLEAAQGQAANTKLEAELESRDNEINVLKEQVKQLMAAAAKSSASAK